MDKRKNIILLFLGDFFFDARCINMALSIIKSKKFNLSILSSSDPLKTKKSSNKDLQEAVQKIKFYQFQDTLKGPLRYWFYHKHIKKTLKNNKYDVIIAADLYSLSGACSQKTNIFFDSSLSLIAQHVRQKQKNAEIIKLLIFLYLFIFLIELKHYIIKK